MIESKGTGILEEEGRRGRTFQLLGLSMPKCFKRCHHGKGAALREVQLGGRILSSHSDNNVLHGMRACTEFTRCSKEKSLGSDESCYMPVLSDISCGLTVFTLWFRCILLTREIAKLFHLLLLPSSWLCFLGPVCWLSRKQAYLTPTWPLVSHVDIPSPPSLT